MICTGLRAVSRDGVFLAEPEMRPGLLESAYRMITVLYPRGSPVPCRRAIPPGSTALRAGRSLRSSLISIASPVRLDRISAAGEPPRSRRSCRGKARRRSSVGTTRQGDNSSRDAILDAH